MALRAYRKKMEAEKEIENLKKNVEKNENKKKKLEGELGELGEEIRNLERRILELEEKIEESLGDEYEDVKKKIDETSIKIATLNNRKEDAEEEIEKLRKEMKEKEVLLKQTSKKLKDAERVVNEYIKSEKRVAKKLKKISAEMKTLHEKMEKSGKESKEFSKKINELKGNIEELEGKKRNLLIERDRVADEIERKSKEIENLNAERSKAIEELRDIEMEIDELKKERARKDVKKVKERFYALKAEERKIVEEKEMLSKRLLEVEREHSRIVAQLEVAGGYTSAVRAVLEAKRAGKLKGVRGTIAQLAEVDEKYELALRVAAGQKMEAIVVDTDEDAEKAIEYLKKIKGGRAIFLPLNKMIEGRPRGKALLVARDQNSLGFAIDLIKFDEKYRAAFWYVFRDTIVMKDLTSARKVMGGVRLVTLDGQLIEPSGAMIGGSEDKCAIAFGRATDSMDAEKLEEEKKEIESLLESMEKRLAEIRKEMEVLEKSMREHNAESADYQVRLDALGKRRKEIRERIKSLEMQIAEANMKLSECLERRNKIDEEIKGIDDKIEGASSEIAKLEARLSDIAPQAIAERMKELSAESNKVSNELNELREKLKNAEVELEKLKQKKEGLEESLRLVKEKINEWAEEIEKVNKELRKLSEEKEKLSVVYRSLGEEYRKIEEEKSGLEERKAECEKRMIRVKENIRALENMAIHLMARKAELEERYAKIVKEFEDYNIGDIKIEDVPSEEELVISIERCKEEMNALGNVNLKAIEDYENEKKRYDEYREELSKLREQKDNLIKVAEELESKKKEALLRVFNGVNENFRKVYAEISNGGEGELILENPESPFEGGLIIKVRPKGKKVSRIEALSGGEKSLASMAFIFAIQQYDPSPFYILDEVDQNLDAVNAEIVAKMIKRDSKNAQFIIISLRKVMLKEADHLYGVTEENGQSYIVSTVLLEDKKRGDLIGGESVEKGGEDLLTR